MPGISPLRIFLLVLTLIITFLVTYWSLVPKYLLQIQVDPRKSSAYIKMDEINMIHFYEAGKPIFIRMRGEITDPVVSNMLLTVEPPDSMQLRSYNIEVSAPFFSMNVGLFFKEKSISQEMVYHYEIRAMNSKALLSEGDILVEVKAIISGTSPWFMIITSAIGFIASIMQVIDLSLQFTRKKKLQEPLAAPPDV